MIPQTFKNIYHLANAVLANIWYGFPSRKIKVIGITGTNGKTTTVQLVAKILENAGHKIAVTSTINFQLGEKKWVNKTKFTTLNAWKVQRFIRQAATEKCEYLVLEVSSHSLDQNRVWGIEFDVAVITNVTREHLDYHEKMAKYRMAKLKLFKMIKDGGTAVVNLDMERPDEFLQQWKGDKYGYSLKIQKENSKLRVIRGKAFSMSEEAAKFSIDHIKFEINLPGKFNVENALAAVSVGLSQGIALEEIAKALREVKGIPGRMDYVKNNKGIDIIVDYALTPDSMVQLGQYIVNSKLKDPSSKLIWVFGSCGERDRGKRPIMGGIVSTYAHLAIVTNEDPYHEDPKQIIDEVFAGVVEGGKRENVDAWRILDRKQAIKKALDLARKGDMILITGKGAEETMAVGDKRMPWNDKKVVLELLNKQN